MTSPTGSTGARGGSAPGFVRIAHVLRAALATRPFERDLVRAAPDIERLFAEQAADRGRLENVDERAHRGAAVLRRVGIAGAGTMGAGIAALAAGAGLETLLCDPDPDALAAAPEGSSRWASRRRSRSAGW